MFLSSANTDGKKGLNLANKSIHWRANIQILHDNQIFRLLCKIGGRPVGRMDDLELMQDDPVLNLHISNGFNKNFFFNMLIQPNLKTIKYDNRTIKNKLIL